MARPSTRNIIPLLPTAVASQPTRDQLSIRTTLVAVSTRTRMVQLRVRSTLSKPAVVERSLIGSDPRLVLDLVLVSTAFRTRSNRRQPHQRLSPPTVLAQPPPVVAVITTAFKTTVRSRIERVRRPTHSKLSPPTVLTAATAFVAPPLSVTNAAVRTRVERGHHRSLSYLGAPVAVGPFVAPPAVLARPIQVTLAAQARINRSKRVPFSRLSYPVVVAGPLIPGTRQLTVTTTLVRTRPRPTHSFQNKVIITAAPPAPVVTKIITTLVRTRPRATHPVLRTPVVVSAAVVAPVVTKISTTLVRTRPRSTHPVLRTPVVVSTAVAPFRPIKTTLSWRARIERKRHAVTSFLRGPVVISPAPAVAPPLENKIRVKTVAVVTRLDRRRRRPRPNLYLPATLVEDPCHPTIHTIPTSDFVPSPLSPDALSPTPTTPDSLSLTPLSGDPLSLTPTSPDDLGAPDDPC